MKRKFNINLEIDNKRKETFVKFEELTTLRSERIKTAKRVEKLGGKEYFIQN